MLSFIKITGYKSLQSIEVNKTNIPYFLAMMLPKKVIPGMPRSSTEGKLFLTMKVNTSPLNQP
jgi:hypothetical protein